MITETEKREIIIQLYCSGLLSDSTMLKSLGIDLDDEIKSIKDESGYRRIRRIVEESRLFDMDFELEN
jgi:hypothetical protein